jgi:hypothetical protein
MRTFAGAGAISALPTIARAFAFSTIPGRVTNITLDVCFGHNFLLALRAALL